MIVGDDSDDSGTASITSVGSARRLPGFEGFVSPRAVDERPVGRELSEVSHGERADIPTAIGGNFDAVYDTAVEQPEWAEDDRDLPGPSIGDALANPRQVGPDYLDELTALVVVLVVLGAALYLARPLLELLANVTTPEANTGS